MIRSTIHRPIALLAMLTIAAWVLAACSDEDARPAVTGSGATSLAGSGGTGAPPSDPSESTASEVTFPMLPAHARHSTPVTGDVVLDFASWPGNGFPVILAIYADGRVIWHPNQNDLGYLQFRLTPAGVESIRSTVISTGLVDRRGGLEVDAGAQLARLTIDRGDREVFVQWTRSIAFGRMKHEATEAEAQDVVELERFLGDPSAWPLPSALYADPKIKAFVPSGFRFYFDRGKPDLSQLPSPAREVLDAYFPWHEACSIISADQARELVEALAQAGFAPLRNNPVYVDFNIPSRSSGPSNPHLTPALPQDMGCLFNGGR